MIQHQDEKAARRSTGRGSKHTTSVEGTGWLNHVYVPRVQRIVLRSEGKQLAFPKNEESRSTLAGC